MGWNGSGTFNRLYSWVADKAAGLNISSTRMDADTNDIASSGFGNCLTRDGQGQPTANLPMGGFRHTGAANGVARSDYATMGQVQDGLLDWTTAGGAADAITATYTPALTALNDGQLCFIRGAASNVTTAPTFAPNGLAAHPITKLGGNPLNAGDIYDQADVILRYNLAHTRWEYLNPPNTSVPTTGDLKLTVKTVADSGWLMLDDGTFGSATSGSSNSNSAANQALFTLIFNNLSDTTAPILTSTGAGTTRAGQGTAAAAWAANCRMTLPKTLGRALGVAGSGAGLTSRALGSTVGEETHTLTLTELATGITTSGSNSIGVSTIDFTITSTTGTTTSAVGGGTVNGYTIATSTSVRAQSSGTNTITATSNNTGGGAHNNMQPSSFFNAMIKI